MGSEFSVGKNFESLYVLHFPLVCFAFICLNLCCTSIGLHMTFSYPISSMSGIPSHGTTENLHVLCLSLGMIWTLLQYIG